ASPSRSWRGSRTARSWPNDGAAAPNNSGPGSAAENRSMTGKVLTITSGKGGVGKTTATANIAVALAANGAKVVCIDGDIGLRNLDVVLGLENRIVYDLV